MRNSRLRSFGFTLIEFLVVIALTAMLAATVLPKIFKAKAQAHAMLNVGENMDLLPNANGKATSAFELLRQTGSTFEDSLSLI